jgi:hypothetical protein
MRSEKDRKTNRRNRTKITAGYKLAIRLKLEAGDMPIKISKDLQLLRATVYNWRKWLGLPGRSSGTVKPVDNVRHSRYCSVNSSGASGTGVSEQCWKIVGP